MKIQISTIYVYIFIVVAFHTNPSFALNTFQDRTDTIAQKDSIDLVQTIEQVTISAFRVPFNSLNIPAAVDYISGNLMTEGTSLTPVDALNKVPGINMHNATLNTNRLTIRGIGSRSPYSTTKIKAYFGNIPLTTGDGETTLEDLETSGLNHVEILKGPSSSLYGAGLGGTILFYPLEPTNNFVQHQSMIASFNTFKHTSMLGINTPKASFFVLLSNLNSDGYRENNKTNRNNFLLNSNIKVGKKINFSLLGRLTKMKAYIPSSLNFQTFTNSPWEAASNWKNANGYEAYTSGQLGVSMKIDNKKYVSIISLFGQFREADELRPFNLLKESTSSFGSRGNFQKTLHFNSYDIHLTGGFEIFRETYKWQTTSNSNSLLSDNKENRNYENIFLQGDFSRSKKVNISIGVNYNRTKYTYADFFLANGDQSGNHTYTPILSQRIGISYRVLPEIALYGNLSHGFSPPTLEETLYPEGTINPAIEPEKGWNMEIGTRGSIGPRFTFNASYYRIYISNLLVARRTAEDAWVGVNAGRSEHPGMEAYMQLQVTPPGSYPIVSIIANSTIANYHFTDFTDNGKDYSGNQLPGTSRFSAYGSVKVAPIKKLDIAVNFRHKGKMPVDDLNSQYTEAYGIADLQMNYKTSIKKLGIGIKAGVNNLFDVNYASMLAVNAGSFGGNAPRYYYPGNPRNYYLSLSFKL